VTVRGLLRGAVATVALGLALGLFSARGDGVQVMVINGLANAEIGRAHV